MRSFIEISSVLFSVDHSSLKPCPTSSRGLTPLTLKLVSLAQQGHWTLSGISSLTLTRNVSQEENWDNNRSSPSLRHNGPLFPVLQHLKIAALFTLSTITAIYGAFAVIMSLLGAKSQIFFLSFLYMQYNVNTNSFQ